MSLCTCLVAGAVLAGFYQRKATHDLIQPATQSNVALAKVLTNILWQEYGTFLSSSDRLSNSELARHPTIREIDSAIASATQGLPIVKVKVFDLQGRTVFSTDTSETGEDKSQFSGFLAARSGQIVSQLDRQRGLKFPYLPSNERQLLSSYLPIYAKDNAGNVAAVFEIYTNITPLEDEINRSRAISLIGSLSILSLLYFILLLFINRAERLLIEQYQKLQTSEARYRRLCQVDKLTQIYNRHKLDEILEDRVRQAETNGNRFAIILLDIDRFKSINDSYGHQVGDDTLSQVANLAQMNLRNNDAIGRWGGEEFLIICSETDADEACNIAERIRLSLSRFDFPVVQSVTASFGVTLYRSGERVSMTVSRADRALYQAKHSGRNRVSCLPPIMAFSSDEVEQSM